MTKARCPIEEYCMKNGNQRCMFESACHNDYKTTCKFNRKLADELKFEIMRLPK